MLIGNRTFSIVKKSFTCVTSFVLLILTFHSPAFASCAKELALASSPSANVFSEREQQLASTKAQVTAATSQFSEPRMDGYKLYHTTLKDRLNSPLQLLSSYLNRDSKVLTLKVQNRTKDGVLVDPKVYANSLFQMTIEHFGVEEIQTIQAEWYWGTDDPSNEDPETAALITNSKQFRENVARGLSEKEAAQATWTGKRAFEHGFRSVEVVGIEPRELGNFMIIRFNRVK